LPCPCTFVVPAAITASRATTVMDVRCMCGRCCPAAVPPGVIPRGEPAATARFLHARMDGAKLSAATVGNEPSADTLKSASRHRSATIDPFPACIRRGFRRVGQARKAAILTTPPRLAKTPA
jgi:hypothetical protein